MGSQVTKILGFHEKTILGDPPYPPINPILTGKWANFKHIPEWLTETSDSTFKGVGEMFEGHSADTRAGKFPLASMGGQAEGLACADPGPRTPIGASGNLLSWLWGDFKTNIKSKLNLEFSSSAV